jgi:hypothetical protein
VVDIAASLHMTRDQVARRASRLGLKRGMSFQDAARRIRELDRRRKGIRALTSTGMKQGTLLRGSRQSSIGYFAMNGRRFTRFLDRSTMSRFWSWNRTQAANILKHRAGSARSTYST